MLVRRQYVQIILRDSYHRKTWATIELEETGLSSSDLALASIQS